MTFAIYYLAFFHKVGRNSSLLFYHSNKKVSILLETLFGEFNYYSCSTGVDSTSTTSSASALPNLRLVLAAALLCSFSY